MAGPKISELDLERLEYEGAVKLEITGGIPTWETYPGSRHQHMVYRIQTSIRPLPGNGCACVQLADVHTRFPDGSIKRPDIAVFCEEPPIQDEILTIIPTAIIEVINPGFEYKDVELNPRFYLSQGVKDVVVVDPRSGVVMHYRTAGMSTYQAPVTVGMLCGCECAVPQVGAAG